MEQPQRGFGIQPRVGTPTLGPKVREPPNPKGVAASVPQETLVPFYGVFREQ